MARETLTLSQLVDRLVQTDEPLDSMLDGRRLEDLADDLGHEHEWEYDAVTRTEACATCGVNL